TGVSRPSTRVDTPAEPWDVAKCSHCGISARACIVAVAVFVGVAFGVTVAVLIGRGVRKPRRYTPTCACCAIAAMGVHAGTVVPRVERIGHARRDPTGSAGTDLSEHRDTGGGHRLCRRGR